MIAKEAALEELKRVFEPIVRDSMHHDLIFRIEHHARRLSRDPNSIYNRENLESSITNYRRSRMAVIEYGGDTVEEDKYVAEITKDIPGLDRINVYPLRDGSA